MKVKKFLINKLLPILLSALWISISEFTRNQFMFISYWTEHYSKMGLVFPSEPLNGAIWGVWSLLFSVFIFSISRKFSFVQTIVLSWLSGFVFMWLVIGNLGVLPYMILLYAIPLSILEVFVAVWIIRIFNKMRKS